MNGEGKKRKRESETEAGDYINKRQNRKTLNTLSSECTDGVCKFCERFSVEDTELAINGDKFAICEQHKRAMCSVG